MLTLTNDGRTFSTLSDALLAAQGVVGAVADLAITGEIDGDIFSGVYAEGLRLHAAAGDEVDGRWAQGAALTRYNNYLVENRVNNTPISLVGLGIRTKGDYAPPCVRTDPYYTADITIKDCVIGHSSRIGGPRWAFHMRCYGARKQRIVVENCIIHTSYGLAHFEQPDADVELTLKGCTLIDCNWRGMAAGAVNTDSPKLKLIDCYIHSALGPALEGMGFAQLEHCATSDDTAYGVGAIHQVAPEQMVKDRVGEDYRAVAFSPLATSGVNGGPVGSTLGLPSVQPATSVTVSALSNSSMVTPILATASRASVQISGLAQTSTLGRITVQPAATSVWVPPLVNASVSGGIDASAAGSAVAHVAVLTNGTAQGAILAKPSQAAAIAVMPYTSSNAFGVISAKSGAKVAVSIPTVVNDSAMLTLSARASGIPSVTIPTMVNSSKVTAVNANGKTATAVPPLSNASRLSGIAANHSASTGVLLPHWHNVSGISLPQTVSGMASASVPTVASDTHLRPLMARVPQVELVELAAYQLEIEHHPTHLYIERQVTQLCVSA